MTPDELRARAAPPKAPLLAALWHAAHDGWDKAHGIAQADEGAEAAWVHAYPHRVEGDESNAGYWYRRAGKAHSHAPLDDEWREIAAALLLEGGL